MSTLNGEHAGNGSISSSNVPAKRKSRTITLKKKLRDSSSSLRQSGSLVDYAEGDEEDDDEEEDQDIDDYGDYAEGNDNEFGEDAYDQ